MPSADHIRQVLLQHGSSLKDFRLTGAVLFGSVARGTQTKDSDADLLVVAESLSPKLHRRGHEISQIKSMFPNVPMDILLLTRDETISNFENHNPLFLDIAEEGIVLLDTDDFLKDLVSEARAYVHEKGIRKFGDGWVFPFKKGIAVPLSKVTNRDFAEAMRFDGRRDYEIGVALVSSSYFDKAIYHFQQCVEKMVKAVLITQGIFQRTHFVGTILEGIINQIDTADEQKEKLKELAEITKHLEPEFSFCRYPGIINDALWLPYKEYSRDDAQETGERASRALKIAEDFLAKWFNPQT